MPKALHPRDNIDRRNESRKKRERRLTSSEISVDTTTRRQYKKEWRKSDHSKQKQHKQYNDQQNSNH